MSTKRPLTTELLASIILNEAKRCGFDSEKRYPELKKEAGHGPAVCTIALGGFFTGFHLYQQLITDGMTHEEIKVASDAAWGFIKGENN